MKLAKKERSRELYYFRSMSCACVIFISRSFEFFARCLRLVSFLLPLIQTVVVFVAISSFIRFWHIKFGAEAAHILRSCSSLAFTRIFRSRYRFLLFFFIDECATNVGRVVVYRLIFLHFFLYGNIKSKCISVLSMNCMTINTHIRSAT